MDKEYYETKYPLFTAQHKAEVAASLGLAGGNGGPKDEDDPTVFTDAGGTQYTAKSYNETVEARLQKESIDRANGVIAPRSAASWGGTATKS